MVEAQWYHPSDLRAGMPNRRGIGQSHETPREMPESVHPMQEALLRIGELEAKVAWLISVVQDKFESGK